MRTLRRFAVIATILPLSLQAQAGQVVGPGGSSQLGNPTAWIPSVQGGAYINVTGNNPRLGWSGAGSGSLEMSVTGVGSYPAGYPDWGFWYRYAGGSAANTISTGASFGNLQALSALSFDWYRSFIPGWNTPSPVGVDNPVPPVDWIYKTPVMRLQLAETRGSEVIFSELVWEGYYNQCSLGPDLVCQNNVTPVDTWMSQQGMQNDAFWYLRPPTVGGTATYSHDGACDNPMSFWEGGVFSQTKTNLFSAATYDPQGALLTPAGCLFGASVQVIGIAVGVGSEWPLPYHGYVDNVRMSFDGQQALDANFDYVSTVPEPSTYALMAAGLLALGVAARRRRQRAPID